MCSLQTTMTSTRNADARRPTPANERIDERSRRFVVDDHSARKRRSDASVMSSMRAKLRAAGAFENVTEKALTSTSSRDGDVASPRTPKRPSGGGRGGGGGWNSSTRVERSTPASGTRRTPEARAARNRWRNAGAFATAAAATTGDGAEAKGVSRMSLIVSALKAAEKNKALAEEEEREEKAERAETPAEEEKEKKVERAEEPAEMEDEAEREGNASSGSPSGEEKSSVAYVSEARSEDGVAREEQTETKADGVEAEVLKILRDVVDETNARSRRERSVVNIPSTSDAATQTVPSVAPTVVTKDRWTLKRVVAVATISALLGYAVGRGYPYAARGVLSDVPASCPGVDAPFQLEDRAAQSSAPRADEDVVSLRLDSDWMNALDRAKFQHDSIEDDETTRSRIRVAAKRARDARKSLRSVRSEVYAAEDSNPDDSVRLRLYRATCDAIRAFDTLESTLVPFTPTRSSDAS